MGVPTLWKELDHACVWTTLEDEAWIYFEKSPHRALRLGIDASLWMFHTIKFRQLENTGAEPELRTLLYRLSNLFSLPILPVFVFDGPERPRSKRGHFRTGGDGWSETPLVRNFREMIDLFGFAHLQAPGEAEAELAWLNDMGFLDAVQTDDVDVLLFGAKKVFRK